MQKMQKRSGDLSTIVELSVQIVSIIDNYMGREIERDELIEKLKPLVSENNKQIFKANDYAVVLKRKLGKKRIIVFDKVVEELGYGKVEV